MPRSDFEWQIGADQWDEQRAEPWAAEPSPLDDTPGRREGITPGTRSRRVVLIVLPVIGVIVVGALLIIARRIDEVATPLVKDILATHQLVQHAAAESDMELLQTLIDQSGGEINRTALQHYLLRQPSPFDRGPLGLHVQAGEPQDVHVDLSPDLKRAEVVSEYAYTIDAGGGLAETVRLRQTIPYRLSNGRWRLSPSGDDFWGSALTSEGQWLTVVYPERDESIDKRLAGDLDAMLGKLCADQTNLECPNDFHVELTLDKGLKSLIDLLGLPTSSNYRFSQPNIADISLPTPTLVGLPIDEAGYQALYRGYAVQIVRQVVVELANRQALDPFIAQAALNNLFVRLKLRPWVPADPGKPLAAAPLPLPDQDMAIVCSEGITQGNSLYRYTPSTGAWIEELSNRNFVWMSSPPNHDGVILQEHLGSENLVIAHISWWRNGEEIPLLDAPANIWPASQPGYITPPDQYLLVLTYGIDQNANSEPITSTLINLSHCTSTGCSTRVTAISGLPAYSPDGVQMIVWDIDHTSLHRALVNGQALARIENALYPFWLNNDTYGYVHWRDGTQAAVELELVMANTGDDRPRTLLAEKDFQAALPERDPSEWRIAGLGPVMVNPANRDVLLIVAYATQEALSVSRDTLGRSYVFLFDRRTGDLSLRVQSNIGKWFNSTSFSPDGRWLTTSELDPAGSTTSIILHNIARNETQTLPSLAYDQYMGIAPSYGWSADGLWLLILDSGVLRLSAPAYNYQQTIVPESPGCVLAAWINRE